MCLTSLLLIAVTGIGVFSQSAVAELVRFEITLRARSTTFPESSPNHWIYRPSEVRFRAASSLTPTRQIAPVPLPCLGRIVRLSRAASSRCALVRGNGKKQGNLP